MVAVALCVAACMACLSCVNDTEYVYEESISLMAMPDKTEYFVGDTLDLTGLAVTSIGKDGKITLIPDSKIAVEPPHGTTLGEAGTLTVTVSHGKRSLNFPIKVSQESICLYVKNPPKRAYYAGDRLDLSGLELVLRENGEEMTIAYPDSISSEPENGAVLSIPADAADASRATRTVVLSYGGLSCSFNVSIRAVRLTDLYLKSLPDRTNYYTGGALDLVGLELVATFSDGTVNVVGDYTVSETPDFTKVGRQTVMLSYLDKKVSFPIEIFKSYFAFSKQPQDAEIALYAENASLSAEIFPDSDGEVTFAWYRKNPGEADFSEIARSEPERVAFAQAKESVIVLPKNDYLTAEYYCAATLTASNGMAQSARSGTAHVTQRVETGLPVVRIDTENGADVVSKEEYVSARFALTSDDYDDLTLDKIQIKGRGNSSWGQPKKPYTLKFDKKNEVLGMAKSKKWVLVANYSDKALLRNDFASYLGNEIFTNMAWNPSFTSVDFILNGEYKGTYLLGEQIKIDEKRVNIQDISDAVLEKGDDWNGDGTVDEKDGGFIFEVNTTRMDEAYNYRTNEGIGMSLKDPDVDDFAGNEAVVEAFMESVIQSAEDALYSETYTDAENGYAKYLDVDSFIDWYLVNELAKNNDACWFSSVYLYYDPSDGKLHMGPDWDFDIGLGNIYYNGCDKSEGFWIKDSGWHNRLFTDPAFVAKVKSRWNEVKGKVQMAVTAEIQSKANAIAASAELNFKRWQILGTYVWPNAAGYDKRNTYQSEVDYLVNWTNNRYEWLDSAINGL